MAEKLLQHKHCLSCGKAVPTARDFCTDTCRDKHTGVLRRKRRQLLYLWVGAMAILALAFILTR
ncbi:MAG: DUF2116 family Zn-ribbon domain-containing protein [Thermoplasmata archaeon]